MISQQKKIKMPGVDEATAAAPQSGGNLWDKAWSVEEMNENADVSLFCEILLLN